MASLVSGSPPLDPIPALKHATGIANQVCHISGDVSLQMSYLLSFLHCSELMKSSQLAWYTRRASLASIYMAAGKIRVLQKKHPC